MSVIAPHRLSGAEFDRLAEGFGRTDGGLRSAQISKRMMLIHSLVSAVRRHCPDLYRDASFESGLSTLGAAQRHDRVRADAMLLHPQVGAWATACVRRLAESRPAAAEDLPPLLGHFGAVVAAVALRAGRDCEVTVWLAPDGSFVLPDHGRVWPAPASRAPAGTGTPAARAPAAGWCRVHLTPAAGSGPPSVTDRPASAARPAAVATRWCPVRRLTATAHGLTLDVALDPYRDCHGLGAAGPARDEEAGRWLASLEEAWRLLCTHHWERAVAIAAGVTSLVPLRSRDDAPELSASSADALGAVALTPPRDGVAFAAALVHEFQHAKLAALLDLVTLHQPDHDRLYYAPWRPDPRPARGLLHGAYAYLGLTDFWGRQAELADGPAADLAFFEFALWRDQVWSALSALESSGALTEPGRRFTAGMRSALVPARSREIPALPRALAAREAADHLTRWRLRNLRVAPSELVAWRVAWSAGQPAPDRPVPTSVIVPAASAGDGVSFAGGARSRLRRLRLRDPDGFAAEADRAGADRADRLICADRAAEAAGEYRRRVAADPDDAAAWAGLALTRQWLAGRAGRPAAGDPLAARPEFVRALHRSIAAGGTPPAPDDLAAWLSDGARSEVGTG